MSKKYKKLKIKFPDFLDEHGIEYDETIGGEIKIIECPSCQKVKKLYVDPETGVAQCKSASCSLVNGVSPFDLVIELLGVSRGEAYKICFGDSKDSDMEDIFDSEDMDDPFFGNNSNKRKKKEKPQNIELPITAEDLDKTKHKEAWDYLINRGYTDEVIRKIGAKIMKYKSYSEGFADLTRKNYSKEDIKRTLMYINRIIFPLYINTEIKGYIARDFTGKVDKQYKALNSIGSFRSHYFWNYDNAKNSDVVVICEGITDALKCGIDRSIALLGTVATKEQINLLKTMNAKKIIFCLDVGTDSSKEKIYDQLMLSYPGNIYDIEMEPLFISKEKIDDEIFKAIEEIPISKNHRLEYVSDNTIYMSYEIYEDIKKKIKSKWFNLDFKKTQELEKFIKNGDYKDAGDFSLEEMEEKIQNASIYSKSEKIDLL